MITSIPRLRSRCLRAHRHASLPRLCRRRHLGRSSPSNRREGGHPTATKLLVPIFIRRQKAEDITVRADDRKHPDRARLRSSAHTVAYSEVRPCGPPYAILPLLRAPHWRPRRAGVLTSSSCIPSPRTALQSSAWLAAGWLGRDQPCLSRVVGLLASPEREKRRSSRCVCFALPRPPPCFHLPVGVVPIPVRSFAPPPIEVDSRFACPWIGRLW